MKPKKIEKIRLLAIKLWNHRHWKTGQVVKELEKRFNVSVSKRTLQLWKKRHKEQDWNLRNKSTRPHMIHYKLTSQTGQWIVDYKKCTSFDAVAIQNILTRKHIQISVSSVKRVIRMHNLQEHTRMKGERLKWVRWQRDAPNSLWQLDWTEEEDGTIRLPVIDDCSRYCLGVRHWKRISTKKVITFLDELINYYGTPRQILTDNHVVVGGTGDTNNEFDKWCKKRGIEHIHTGINKPTKTGKTQKIHDTYNRAIKRWHKDPEYWRYSYNHNRPHRSLYGKHQQKSTTNSTDYYFLTGNGQKRLQKKRAICHEPIHGQKPQNFSGAL